MGLGLFSHVHTEWACPVACGHAWGCLELAIYLTSDPLSVCAQTGVCSRLTRIENPAPGTDSAVFALR